MIAPPTEAQLLKIPPGDRTARLQHYAKLYRETLVRPAITAQHRERVTLALISMRALAQKLGCRVRQLEEESNMAEAPNTAVAATRAFEAAAARMHSERGVPEEEVALALISAGLSRLSAIWPPERVVQQLAGIIGALMETHGIDPNTAERGPQPTRN